MVGANWSGWSKLLLSQVNVAQVAFRFVCFFLLPTTPHELVVAVVVVVVVSEGDKLLLLLLTELQNRAGEEFILLDKQNGANAK